MTDRGALRLRNPNMTCGDCEYLDENGWCPQMAEALVLEGWPKADASPVHKSEASAETCPVFERSDASRNAPMRPGWEEKVDQIYEGRKVGI